jgi:hypothetical protein
MYVANFLFDRVKGRLLELATDPYGNYLVQKLITFCDVAMLEAITAEV